MPGRGDQPSAIKLFQMKRSRRRRRANRGSDFAGGNAIWPLANEQSENVEPLRVRERRQRSNSCISVHEHNITTNIEVFNMISPLIRRGR